MKENETKTQNNHGGGKGSRAIKTILNTIINILIVLVLVTSILIAVLSLTSKANNGVATIFGYSFHTIQTPSMDGGSPDFDGGDYKVGDLVIGKAQGAGDRDYSVGDIISYRTESDEGDTMLICHRIINTSEDNGTITYQTQGDANDTPDQLTTEDYIHSYDITSLCYDDDYHGAVLKGWGKPLDFIREPQGFFFAVLLPMIIFFMYEIIRVVLNAMSYRKSKEQEAKENAEKEKNDAVQAAVKAALAEKEAGRTVSMPGAPADMTPEQMEQFKQFMEFQKMQNAAKEAEQKSADTEE